MLFSIYFLVDFDQWWETGGLYTPLGSCLGGTGITASGLSFCQVILSIQTLSAVSLLHETQDGDSHLLHYTPRLRSRLAALSSTFSFNSSLFLLLNVLRFTDLGCNISCLAGPQQWSRRTGGGFCLLLDASLRNSICRPHSLLKQQGKVLLETFGEYIFKELTSSSAQEEKDMENVGQCTAALSLAQN